MVPQNQTLFGYDFGHGVPVPATTVGGSVYLDTDNNGQRDTGETGIAGVTISLTPAGQTTGTTITSDNDGNYTFANVGAGSYTIIETQPANVLQGTNAVGTLGGNISSTQVDVFENLTVNGTAGSGYLFGEQPLPANPPAAPTANNQAVPADQNGTVTGNVLTDDGGAANRGTVAAAATGGNQYVMLFPGSGPQHAQSFVLNRDGSFIYVPRYNYFGADAFQYQVVGANGRIALADVNITIKHVNQAPTPSPETSHDCDLMGGTSVDIALSDQMQDVDSTGLTFKVKGVTGGTYKMRSDGRTVRFTADKTFSGDAVLSYTASDGQKTTATTFVIHVAAAVQLPTAGADSAVTSPSTTVAINALANDKDPLKAGVYLLSVADPAHATAYISNPTDPAKMRIVYKPDFGFHGTESFKYVVSTFDGAIATGMITVTVKPGAGVGIDPTNKSRTALDVWGTPGADKIVLGKNNGMITVTMNGVLVGQYSPSGLVAVSGDGGNDTIDASAITSNNVVLFGDAGDDTLIGGPAKTVLAGGVGRDKLYAGSGPTSLIDGVVDYATKGYAALSTLFNGSTNIGSYAHNDTSTDDLYGGSGKDQFWANITGSGTFDVLHNRKEAEPVIDIG